MKLLVKGPDEEPVVVIKVKQVNPKGVVAVEARLIKPGGIAGPAANLFTIRPDGTYTPWKLDRHVAGQMGIKQDADGRMLIGTGTYVDDDE